jgi:hypothetical protein
MNSELEPKLQFPTTQTLLTKDKPTINSARITFSWRPARSNTVYFHPERNKLRADDTKKRLKGKLNLNQMLNNEKTG